MNIAVPIKPSLGLAGHIDKIIIIGSPLLAFLAIAMFCETRSSSGHFLHNPSTPEWLIAAAVLLTHSHIFLVFIRSHLNPDVLKRHPFRFTSIPLFMLAAIWSSSAVFGLMGFIALYWDEWHSLMQTFGFGRIYDAKLGSDPTVGRKLDIGMAFVVGLLPHVVLLTYMPENVRVEGLLEFMAIEREVGEQYGHFIHSLKYPLILFGFGYTIFYIHSYKKLVKQGYKYSRLKFALFLSTGMSACLMASLYSVTDAAYFGNIYHALQYYFIVYFSEGPRLPKRLGWKKESTKKVIKMYFCFFLLLAVAGAATRTLTESTFGFLGSFWLLTSLLHFWYDGFIWSVRKQDV